MMRGRRHARQPGLPLMLLLMQMFNVGFDRIPPVTLGTIAMQVVIFLRLVNLPWPSISEVCISPINVWYKEEWQRLVLAAFFHLNDWHLYYNMVSFLWKGISLERRLGSAYFAYIIAVFAVLTSSVTVVLGIAADNILQDSSYLSQCAAGFSGVLFALKVITTHLLPPGRHYLMGFIPVPSRWACWAELVLIQVLVPNASFLGHLAGILVGFMYVKGPLKYIMDLAIPAPPSYTYAHGTASGGRSSGRASGRSGQQGYRPQYREESQNSDYYQYHGGLSEEEQMQQAMNESLRNGQSTRSRSTPSAPPPFPPPAYDTLGHNSSGYGSRSAPYPSVSPNYRTESPYASERQSYTTPSAPPYPTGSGSASSRLYPDLSDTEEMRRRRLARFDS